MTDPNENIIAPNVTENTFETPKSELLRMHIAHLGKIFSNISIVALIIGLGGIFSFILYGLTIMLAFLGWLLLAIMSLGLVFIAVPNFLSFFNSGLFTNTISLSSNLIYIIFGIGIACSIVSIILLAFDKHGDNKGRIIFSSIVLIAILLILIAIIGGAL